MVHILSCIIPQKNIDVTLAKEFQERFSKEHQVGWHNMYVTAYSVPDCEHRDKYYFIVVYYQGLSILNMEMGWFDKMG